MPKPAERLRAYVYDSINENRLLGWVYADEMPDFSRGEYVRFAVASGLPKVFDVVAQRVVEVEVRTITFWRSAPRDNFGPHGDWVQVRRILTDAPLKDLLNMREFHLPNETNGLQAEYRRNHY